MTLDAFKTTGSSPTGNDDPPCPERAGPGYTDIIHGGLEPDPATGAILTPIYQSTTYVQEAVGQHKGYTYTRSGNPTVAALERNLAKIEGAAGALCFATGMAAISSLFLALLRAGDRILVSDVVYGGTVRLLRQILDGFGVETLFVDTSNPDAVAAAIDARTRLVFIESPANPTLKLTDIAAVAAVAHDCGVPLAVDNTFLTPVLQRPFELGADFIVYSTTKYIEGHNSTVGGALLSREEAPLERLRLVQKTLGVAQSPWESWLTLRGIKTLPIRMQRHSANALEVARWLEEHPGVTKVAYPWLESFPQTELARRQQAGGGGMLAFEIVGGSEPALRLLRELRLCSLAENLGAVETLVTHPASMTHASLTAAERESLGLGDGLIRLSVGLEEPGDIIADLEQGLETALGEGGVTAKASAGAASAEPAPAAATHAVAAANGGER